MTYHVIYTLSGDDWTFDTKQCRTKVEAIMRTHELLDQHRPGDDEPSEIEEMHIILVEVSD